MATTAPIYAANCAFDNVSGNPWNNPGNANGAPGADYSDCTVDTGNPPASFLIGDVAATQIPGSVVGVTIYASVSSAAAPVSAGIQVYFTDNVNWQINAALLDLTTSAQTTYSAAATLSVGTFAQMAASIRAGMAWPTTGGFQVEGTSNSGTPTTIRLHGVWAVVTYATADQLAGGADDSLLLTGIRR